MADIGPNHWRRIIERVKKGEVIPIVSDRVIGDFLPGYHDFAAKWAEGMEYPFKYRPNITRLAQYLSVDLGSSTEAKRDFLNFYKGNLLESCNAASGSITDIESKRFAKIAQELNCLKFENGAENPLHLLAQLPLPLYLTTSYFNFLEIALEKKYRQEPVVEVCQWYESAQIETDQVVWIQNNPVASKLQEILLNRFSEENLQVLMQKLGIYYQDLKHDTRINLIQDLIWHLQQTSRIADFIIAGQEERPDVPWQEIEIPRSEYTDKDIQQPPLVYHLYGLDKYPESLVLTENDYLDFFQRIRFDKDAKNSFISYNLRAKLSQNPLLLLGYDLQDWEFRVLFRGIIAGLRELSHQDGGIRLAIQLRPENVGNIKQAEEYLEKYFGKHNFTVYWGSPAKFMQKLSQGYHEKYG